MSKRSTVNLFEYLDYRKYLRAWYEQSKQTRASCSFRTFSKRAGFRSTNFFKLVMEGKRNLTKESLAKFMVGLKLNKQEQDFFQNLVLFNQAKNHQEKNQHYQRLSQSRKYKQLKPIEIYQYEYYSTWYHMVVRELIASKEFDGTPEWIAERVFPEITSAQAEKSILLLEQLNFIKRTASGHWKQVSSVISTGPEVKSLAIFNYHKNLLTLSQDILEQVLPGDRDMSAMTLGVARDKVPQIKQKIQAFRQEIMKFVAADVHPDEVIQLNMQLFPLSKKREEETS